MSLPTDRIQGTKPGLSYSITPLDYGGYYAIVYFNDEIIDEEAFGCFNDTFVTYRFIQEWCELWPRPYRYSKSVLHDLLAHIDQETVSEIVRTDT